MKRRVSQRSEKKELESAIRQSVQVLPFEIGFAVVAAAAAWAVYTFTSLPTWLAGIIAFFGMFGACFDAINIVAGRRMLKRLSSRDPSAP